MHVSRFILEFPINLSALGHAMHLTSLAEECEEFHCSVMLLNIETDYFLSEKDI